MLGMYIETLDTVELQLCSDLLFFSWQIWLYSKQDLCFALFLFCMQQYYYHTNLWLSKDKVFLVLFLCMIYLLPTFDLLFLLWNLCSTDSDRLSWNTWKRRALLHSRYPSGSSNRLYCKTHRKVSITKSRTPKGMRRYIKTISNYIQNSILSKKIWVFTGQIPYEYSIWCRWPDLNRYGVATEGF